MRNRIFALVLKTKDKKTRENVQETQKISYDK